MNAKIVIFTGTIIAALAFVVEIVGFGNIARPIFMLGLGIALLGVILTLFYLPNTNKSTGIHNFCYRLSIVGFLTAATSIMAGNYLELGNWIDILFRIGAGLFIVGAVLPMFFAREPLNNR